MSSTQELREVPSHRAFIAIVAVSVVAFIGVGVAVVILSRDDAMPAAAT